MKNKKIKLKNWTDHFHLFSASLKLFPEQKLFPPIILSEPYLGQEI